MFRIFLIIVLYSQFCNSQENFKYREIEHNRNYIDYEKKGIVEISQTKLTDNLVENTALINAYLKKYKVVKLPNIEIIIDERGIELNSNNILIFDTDTSLKIIGNHLENYQVLRIHNVENVEIYNPTIIGDRYYHSGNKGEWGHGISILSARNIKIFNYKVEKCWGDGVYIGRSKKGIPSTEIFLYNGFLDNNRRNGLSITSAKNVTIESLVSSNTHGTLPMYGLVIEPNNNEDVIEKIFIRNVKTYNNEEGGVNININKLGRGENKRNVTINIDNFQDFYSKVGFLNSNVSVNPDNFYGTIELSNFELYYNTTPIVFKSSKAENLVIKVQNIDWKYPKRTAFTKEGFIKNIRKRKDIIYIK